MFGVDRILSLCAPGLPAPAQTPKALSFEVPNQASTPEILREAFKESPKPNPGPLDSVCPELVFVRRLTAFMQACNFLTGSPAFTHQERSLLAQVFSSYFRAWDVQAGLSSWDFGAPQFPTSHDGSLVWAYCTVEFGFDSGQGA